MVALFEVMLSVAIITVLMALLLPAVQAARSRIVSNQPRVGWVRVAVGGGATALGASYLLVTSPSPAVTAFVPPPKVTPAEPAARPIVASGTVDPIIVVEGSDVNVQSAEIVLRFPSDGGDVTGRSVVVHVASLTSVECVTRTTSTDDLTGTFDPTTGTMELTGQVTTQRRVVRGCEGLDFGSQVLESRATASVDLSGGTIQGTQAGGTGTFEATFQPVTAQVPVPATSPRPAPTSDDDTLQRSGLGTALGWSGIGTGALSMVAGGAGLIRRRPEDDWSG